MTTTQSDNPAGGRFVDRLSAAPAPLRRALLTNFLREQLGNAIGIDEAEIAADDKLMDLGIDSLRAVEMKMYLEDELGIVLGSSLLFDYPTLNGLVGCLLKELGLPDPQGAEPASAASAASVPPAPASDLDIPDGLSEQELAALLEDELNHVERMN
uniref:Oxidoreductase n=1 Tax=uncultured Acidobacteria bacterium A3 TaxID=1036853 RepID=F8TTI1_9BACT|nr:oxidoreductase [uncultured Acidobacteria bacterium A3]